VNGIDKPKGIIYIDIADEVSTDLVQPMQQALGWIPDPVIDSDKRNYGNYLRGSIAYS
jgi:hypothetical protein